MFRGFCTFVCDECKHKFMAADIEYGATAYSMPQKCPKCGSRHTYPKSIFNLFSSGKNKEAYKNIWRRMDEESAKK